jgi:hypothetical protein
MPDEKDAQEDVFTARAEEIAWQFLEHENCVVSSALDRAAEHEEALMLGIPADSQVSAALFVECADDPATGRALAARVVKVLRRYLWA